MAGFTICINIKGGQITEVAIPIGARVFPGTGRIIVTSSGQSRDLFTALYSGATDAPSTSYHLSKRPKKLKQAHLLAEYTDNRLCF